MMKQVVRKSRFMYDYIAVLSEGKIIETIS